MGRYKVIIHKPVFKFLKKLPSSDLTRILERIGKLSDEPRPADCRKLTRDQKYRIRCGQYRILYKIEDDVLVVYVVKVGHRREIHS